MIGPLENVRRGTAAPEIAVIPDMIALALAQLVRDRWAAEGGELAARKGTLHVLVTPQ